jgi:hypothetical protein
MDHPDTADGDTGADGADGLRPASAGVLVAAVANVVTPTVVPTVVPTALMHQNNAIATAATV